MRHSSSDTFVLHWDERIMLLIFVLAVVLPVSMSFWIVTSFLAYTDEADTSSTSPARWLISVLIPIIIASYGLKKKGLDYSGALAGFYSTEMKRMTFDMNVTGLFVGFVLTFSSYCFMASLLCFFLTSSKATKFRSEKKRKLEDNYKEGGQRNWVQVLCNGGMAAEMGLMYLIDRGCGERVVDFVADYRGSWLAMSVLAAIACSNGDTWASEFGTVVGNSQPILITGWRRVPRGTNGGVSFVGIVFSILGGFAVGLSYYCCQLMMINQQILADSPPQWPVIVIGTLAGFLGSLVDSVLGASLQFSGIDQKTGHVVEKPAPGVRRISGLAVFDNHSVNLLSSIASALLIPRIAMVIWEVFV